MAKNHSTVHEFGYLDERFESVLSDNLHCAICSCVLKDPVMCKNEHCFCRRCITMHLENYQNCPSCNQALTVESLADAPRIVRNLLSEQRIKCDYHERGCEEIVQLGNLASHVAACGKAPVVCSNEECSKEINREDQLRHESEECRFREVKCRNCKEMGSMVQEIGTSLDGLSEQFAKLNAETKTSLTAMENKFAEMRNRFEKMENRFEEMENRFEKRVNQFINHEGAHDNMKGGRSDQSTAADTSIGFEGAREHAYIVAGGEGSGDKLLNSAEIFDKTSNSWRKLQPMKTCRADASSVVYNGQFLVAGGRTGDYLRTSSMEQFSPFWSHFHVNMPKALSGHRSVLYDDRMFIIGGYDPEKKDYSHLIYEIQLRFPFITKILAKLPSSMPIKGFSAVLVNDQILLFGGRVRGSYGSSKSVTMYDISKNEFKELAPLSDGVENVATVKFEENVILAGGFLSNAVVSYNVETQKSVRLPSMKSKRSHCCAVVDDHSMVVMGGSSDFALKSVEAYDFRTSTWRNLPSMNEARQDFVAEII